MIEIKRMYHTTVGTIVFEDINGQWWQQESYNPEAGAADEWTPVVASKIDKPVNV